MDVVTPFEQLLFNVARIELPGISSGTGFFLAVESEPIDNPEAGGDAVFLVTNKHVIEGHQGVMAVHMIEKEQDADRPNLGANLRIDARLAPDAWTFHPDPEVDVAVVPFGAQIEAAKQADREPFLRTIKPSMMLSESNVGDLDAVQDVVFFGYPNAMFDQVNLTPITRRGITATPVVLDWGGKPIFLVDASVFPGSSGSPVYIAQPGSWTDRTGNLTVGEGRYILLGVVAASYETRIFSQLEQLVVPEAAPTADIQGIRTAQTLNLGVVFKAAAIMDCVDIILARSNARRREPAPGEDQRQQDVHEA